MAAVSPPSKHWIMHNRNLDGLWITLADKFQTLTEHFTELPRDLNGNTLLIKG